jgi:tetratricopeptide (TPR) repeat protein
MRFPKTRFPKTLIFFLLAISLVLTLPAWAQQKPFTQEQVSNMVRDGFGDESGAKLIEQRGIDFAPTDDFIQTLKTAGANEAFINALHAAVGPGLSPARNVAPNFSSAHADLKVGATTATPEPASAKKPISQVQVFALLASQVPSHRVSMLVQERGIDFAPTDDYLQEVRLAGGEDELISALKVAKVTKPATVGPTAQVGQAEILKHAARGAEFAEKGQYAEAEQEYRAALLFDPHNADLYDSLGYVLGQQNKLDNAAAAAREALRLNPDDGTAHTNLGVVLGKKGDADGEIAEYREALRLNPNDDMAHNNLGVVLGNKGDWDGEIAEEREALRLNPKLAEAHVNLGLAFGRKGDRNGEIAEYRRALRLNPNLAEAHHDLFIALISTDDWDGIIAEERAALQLNPNYEQAHYLLGYALEKKGDMRGALEEYRAAYTLDPKHTTYKENYERLLHQMNR